jgi:hypothetical protein
MVIGELASDPAWLRVAICGDCHHMRGGEALVQIPKAVKAQLIQLQQVIVGASGHLGNLGYATLDYTGMTAASSQQQRQQPHEQPWYATDLRHSASKQPTPHS